MKNYLSFGAGVNSVAMLLLLLDLGWEFETIYVDHGGDWPETKEYVNTLLDKGYKIKILVPDVRGISNLYDYLEKYQMIPSRQKRWCTDKFKVRVINKYIQKSCVSLIGFSADEIHRARINPKKGIENRYPLIEYGIDRQECKNIILRHGLPVPIKSGCFFCPFQRIEQWKILRRKHPALYCKAKELENNQIAARKKRGKGPLYLCNKPLDRVVNESQRMFWEKDQPVIYEQEN